MKKIMSEIWDFVKRNFGWLIVLTVLLVLFMRGCFDRPAPIQPTITTETDTVYVIHDTVVYVQPQIIKTVPYVVTTQTPAQYIPDTNYARLKLQFEQLRDNHLAQNIQKDVLAIDSIGTVTVTDTTQYNKIIGRSYHASIKERIVTNTIIITQPTPPRNQLYVGASFTSQLNQPNISQVYADFMLKNKKDVMFGPAIGYDFNLKSPVIKLSILKKIKL